MTLLRDDGTPQRIKINGVTEGFFELFGLPMTLGGFVHENFVAPAGANNDGPPQGAPPVVVISHRIWREMYNSDPAIVGKPIRFAEVATTIAGVAPRDFDTPHGGDFWFSQQLDPDDINHFFEGFMRLKPGVTLRRAEAEMAPVMEGLGRDFPASDRNRIYVTKPLVTAVVGDLGPILIIVMSATSLLLLLAASTSRTCCWRAVPRGRGRWRSVSPSAPDADASSGSCSPSRRCCPPRARCLELCWRMAACARCWRSARRSCRAWTPSRSMDACWASRLSRWSSARPWSASRLPCGSQARMCGALMNESTRSTSGGRGTARWLSVMTVVEIALAIMLVAGAGWLVRGFASLRNTELGFAAEKRLLFDMSFQGAEVSER